MTRVANATVDDLFIILDTVTVVGQMYHCYSFHVMHTVAQTGSILVKIVYIYLNITHVTCIMVDFKTFNTLNFTTLCSHTCSKELTNRCTRPSPSKGGSCVQHSTHRKYLV